MSSVLVIGEPIVAVMPEQPAAISEQSRCRFSIGGAELNTAVALRRLGVDVHYVGAVGDDLLGRMVVDHLRAEDIATGGVVIDPSRPTACYVREWLPDGRRRVSYHRSGSAGTALSIADVVWPDPDLVHVTGITLALGSSPAALIDAVVERATAEDVPVSFDPNHRPALWSAEQARPALVGLAERSRILLMSEDDRDAMFPGVDDRELVGAMQLRTGGIVVLKLGVRGAIAADGARLVEQPAEHVEHAVDPVGAGDAFDAGFLAAHLAGTDLTQALRLGAHVAARVVEVAGDHDGAPCELPADLAASLVVRCGHGPTTEAKGATP